MLVRLSCDSRREEEWMRPPRAESLTCPQTSAPVCDTLLICRAELNRSMLRFTGKKRKKGQKLCENMPQFLCDCVCFAQEVEA